MAANQRSQNNCLTLLEQSGEEFNFFQAIRLLDNMPELRKKLRYKAINSEAFAPNFIASVEHQSYRNTTVVAVNAFGLTGQQGPIPSCYAEMLRRAQECEGDDPNAFLDIFHDQLVSLLYEIKKQFDPMLFNQQAKSHPLYDLYSSLTGLATFKCEHRLPITFENLTANTPIVANRRVDYSLLKKLLEQFLQCQLSITPNQGAWRNLPQKYQAQLAKPYHHGPQSLLGQGIGLGTRFWDNQAAISIDINVATIEQCIDLLPPTIEPCIDLLLPIENRSTLYHEKLVALLTFLTDGQYLIYVRLLLDWQAIPISSIGVKSSLLLGYTSWLKSNTQQVAALDLPHFTIYPDLQHDFARQQSKQPAEVVA